MKIPDEVLKEYRKRTVTMDIPKPVGTGHTEISKEKRAEAVENLKKWINENEKKESS